MIEIQVNRASALFKQAADRLNKTLSSDTQHEIFSYWCKYYGENPDEQETSVKILDANVYNKLESKANVNQLLKKHGITDVFPATFDDLDYALAYSQPVDIWFVKPSALSGGRGIEVLQNQDLQEFELPDFHIIQEGVENIKLIDKYKFTVRIYLLLLKGKVYLFDDGFLLIHGSEYQKKSTEYSVQIDHRGYQSEDSSVKMQLLSDYVEYDQTIAQARIALKKILPIFNETLDETSERKYLLIGIDMLLLDNGGIKFIEINAMPNFVHSQKINQELNIPFFENTMRMIYELGSSRFHEINNLSPEIDPNHLSAIASTKKIIQEFRLKDQEEQRINDDPSVYLFEDYLSKEEVNEFIEIASSKMERALVSAATKGITSKGRTGSNCWIPHDESRIIKSVAVRISKLLDLPLSNAESFQVIHYGTTQEYREHFDAWDSNTERGQRAMKRGGQRLVTCLLYLNDVISGGGTGFPKLDFEVNAKKGRMVVFQNCQGKTNQRHPLSLHAGLPVEDGEKWAVNLWFREGNYWNEKSKQKTKKQNNTRGFSRSF